MKQRKKNILERRKRRILSGVIALVLAVSLGVGLFMNSGTTTQAAGTTAVDPDTTNVWSDIAASSTSTQNIGRIWTDKSVFDDDYTFTGTLDGQTISKDKDSDFLVSLSALSSTSNLKTTTTTSQPLDIVLVLDDSGSMAYGIDSDTPNQIVYTAVSADQVVESHGHTEPGWFGSTSYIQDTRGGEYYVQNDRGGYDRITEVTETHSGEWLEGSYEEHVRWTVNGQTVDPETTQFYTRTEYDLSERRSALQYAVSNFIDQAAAMNAQIADENDKIRISIVVFDSNSSIENHLTVCEGANVGTLKNTVNNLEANGATNAGAGMTNANNELRTNSNREDTKQIVIFFTDGVPTTSNSFNTTVANTAVGQASQIKSRGGSVYSIGIFDGADPSQTEVGRNPNDTDRANVFMNAVSSNYPNATAWNNLGQRASGNPDFYKSADNAGSLNEVFQDIFDESTENAGSGSPIEEVTHEGELNPGTLTFTDDLGSYMEVSGNTMTVVYGDRKFTSTNKTTAGNVDTYHFEGTVAGNAIYKEANLADLTVTVTHSDDLATGDKVTVQIPASLIPMRNYDVDTNEKTMSVSAAYPIRLFYGVSVKEEVEKAIEQGSGDVYDAIKEDHLSEDGTIDFYSNAYAENAPNGLTEATFTPSEGNKFYYYTQDTPLYVDEECNTRATSSNIGSLDRVYYADTYWTTENGTTSETTEGMVVVRGGIEFGKIQYDQQGRAYMPAHTQRTDRPNTLITAKEDFEGGNATGTALNVLVPGWNDNGIVSQALGNNGKISYPAPGELEIKKAVDWGNASDETKEKQNSFEFTVNFNGDETLEGDFAYDVYESGEDSVDNGTVTDGGTITLKDGQRAVIKGLPSDTTFTVTETEANENGFTTTDTVTADPNNDTTDGIANGTIKGGSQQSVSFQNNYKADEPVKLSTETGLKVKKNLTGRDWRASDEFSFQITQIDNGAATVQMDDPTKVDITQQTDQQTASFGDITFSESGQYRFRVEELSDADQGITPIAGIDYSGAIYRVTVDVADAGQGNLEVTSVLIEQMINDDGGQGSGEVQGDTMEFTNKYVVGQASETLQGTKIYTDPTGGNPIDAGKFSFQLEALGGYETGTVTGETQPDDYTIAADSDAMPKPAGMTGTTLETGNVGDVFQFPTIYFDGNDVGKTFEYRITELAQQYQGNAEAGMTYDTNSYVVKIVVTEEQDPDSEEPKVVIQAEPNLQPSDIEFTNKYEPEAAELTGDDVIHGTKTLKGRQMKEGETFYFQLSALNDNAKTVLANPETVTVTDQNSMDFAFGEMKFTKVGTYSFQVNEVADEQGTETTNEDGMTFDTNICTVTVTVTDGNDSDNPDDHGKLLASVSYSNDKHSDATDHAQFTNVYEANMNYGAEGAGGIAVTKTMVDRTMAAGDYKFTLEGTGPDGEIKEEFTNTASAANGTVTMKQLQNLTFDEQDAEKTFSFTVDEADPTDENRLAGVEYDQSQYRIDITVHDNYDGTMYTETTVTKTKNADGTEANEIVVDKLNSTTDQGKVPTFGFTNTYKPTEASLDGDTALQVTKEVTGASSPDGVNYTFTLTAQDTNDGSIANIGGLTDGKLTVSTNGVINQDATDNTDDDTQTVSFGKLTFTEPGTYTFKVQENQPTADEGWTFDDADGDGVTDEHTVTVVVSDLNEDNEYDGALHIQSVTPEAPTVITNSYKAGPVIVGGEDAEEKITVQKSVTGADSDAEFKFKIEPVIDDDHTQQWWQDRVQATDGFSPELTISGVTQAQAVTDSFAGIQFNAVGEYKFNVTEVGAADFNAGADRKGWTYDEHTAVVTVKVTDEGNDGQLDAEVVYDNISATTEADKSAQAAAFTNKYVPAEVTTGDDAKTGIQVTKKVTGHDAVEAFDFSLMLAQGQDGTNVYEGSGETKTAFDGMTVTTSDGIKNGATETKTFDDITFTAEGDYTFVIDETTEKTDEGWTYDTTTKEVTVHVKDDGEGNLYIESIDNNAPEFENEYQLTPGKFRAAYFKLQGNKVLDGRNWEAGDEFTFTLTAGEGENVDGTKMAEGEVAATMPAKTTDTIKPMEDDSKVSDNTAQFTFTSDRIPGGSTVEEDTFTYSKPGTYRYLIRETNPNVAAAGSGILGVSYDQTVYRLTVVVTDKGDGTLDAKGTYTKQEANGEWTELGGSDQITFTNTYSSDKVNITFNAFKVLEGRETAMKDNEFTFHMEFAGWKANDDQSDNWSMDGEVAENAPDAAADKGNIIRGDVTFNGMDFTADQVGYTYRYAITEVNGGQTIDGVTIDDSTHYVTAKVTSVQQANEDGTFTEHVRVETSGEAEYDETNQAAPTTGAIFKNTYDPGETTVDTGEADFDLTKILKGKDWNGDKFTFEISPVSAMNDGQEIVAVDSPDFPMPAETSLIVDAATGEDEEGNDQAVFSFGNIKYDQEGVYTYKVKEVAPAEGEEGYNAGITYSNNEATVVVTVTDNNEGGYTTAVNISGNEFVNEYHASADYDADANSGLDITKKLNNRNMTADQFTFTIEATGDNAADAAKKLGITDGTTTTVKNNDGAAGAAVSVVGNPFENMTFDETDDGVTYTYTIKEEGKSGEGDYAGYTLDDTTYTVKITATDKGDGTMTVTTDVNGTEYTDERATVAFENTYKAGDVTVGAEGAAQIKANKTLKNDNIANYAGKFNFQVTSGNVVVAKGTNDANGNITFGDITYTTENLAAAVTAGGSEKVGKASLDTTGEADVYTFNYSVSEVTTGLPGGVTYGDGDTNITVTVTDDRHGKLDVKVGYADGATSVEFVNIYGAGEDGTAELNLKGNKEIVPGEGLTEAPALVDDTYTFEITGNAADDGTPAPMPAETTATNKSGAVKFGPITFTMENVFGTTQTTQDVMVEEEQTAEETTVEGETTPAEGEAEAVAGEEAAVTEGETVTAGVANADEGIELQTAGRTKTFTYTIKETAGSVPGVDNDTTVKTVTVTVTDEGDGKISVKAAPDEGADKGNDFTFTNVYNVDPKGSSLTGDGGFTITKTLTGRDMAQGEFSFRLQSADDDSDFWTAATNPAAADGEAAEISFGDVLFEKPGTYTYTLEEEQGNLAGVEYDSNKYTVIATVTDKDADGNYTGELEVTWQINGAADNIVAFENTYTADPTSVSLGAGKLIKGRDLKAGEFSFLLSDANGKEIDTAKNEENGAVTFKTITFDKAGAYSYEIREVLPEDDDSKTDGIQSGNVTYDENIYHVTVDVKDNTEKGCLEATVTYEDSDGAPVFINTYTEPKKETPAGNDGGGTILGVKTGDVAEILPLLIVMAAAIVVIIAMSVILIRRRRR
ncbi:VWA domain-containing protein [Mordavella massiliensis]|nr:VWA domain-containing protein [Mordavella massiliensis]